MNDEQIQGFKDIAKNNLRVHGNLTPVFILESRDGNMDVIAPDFSSDESKQESADEISNMLESGNFKSFLQISEAWSVRVDEDKDPFKTRPSLHPNKIECVILMYKEDTGNGFMIQIPFKKINGNYRFEEEMRTETEDSKNLGGLFWDMWR